ncbi:Rieske (2Fe-2S) protein [Solimonas terrae]|uniref:Rieske (2Fe-2S) protein n=1 Tax=Solimonas terrae TaxID=1396819 RepID=A0A6M2BNQ7_9GAMM|nr:Rieske (2Fe-2S) protein [Solimonas terrae]NGY03663.1 Rieske (2Fe-2S) protein [Solimonas terrae]
MAEIDVANVADVREGAALTVRAAGRSIVLTRVAGTLCAVENRCPHLGLPLARGRIVDGVIRCPFRGSSFDLCSGANLDWVNAVAGLPLPQWSRRIVALGREPMPLQTFVARERDGRVYLEA